MSLWIVDVSGVPERARGLRKYFIDIFVVSGYASHPLLKLNICLVIQNTREVTRVSGALDRMLLVLRVQRVEPDHSPLETIYPKDASDGAKEKKVFWK